MSKFVVYERAYETLLRRVGDPKQPAPSTMTAMNLAAGLIAGVAAALVSHPVPAFRIHIDIGDDTLYFLTGAQQDVKGPHKKKIGCIRIISPYIHFGLFTWSKRRAQKYADNMTLNGSVVLCAGQRRVEEMQGAILFWCCLVEKGRDLWGRVL